MSARGFLMGAAVAAGALMLVPGVASAVARAGRPAMRRAARAGAAAYGQARTSAAELYETAEDVAAEVRAEMHAASEGDEPEASRQAGEGDEPEASRQAGEAGAGPDDTRAPG